MSDRPKKKGRPRQPDSLRSRGANRHRGKRVVFYLGDDVLAALDGYCARLRHRPGRSQVLRDLVLDLLRREGDG